MAKGKVLETLVRLSGEIDPSYKKAFAVAGAATKVFSLKNKETTNSMRRAQVVGGALANLASGALQSGFRAVSNSMDSAIDRVDTLNSYSKTMENLGFSVEEVSKASEKLQKGIDGLPTTLPAITTMQQQYTALTGDISKATELTVALNDATLAGGQGQEVASRAMEQWYKVIAKGKPDLDAWTSINSAMPAQMNQIAQSLLGTKAKSQDLFEAWKSGKVTTEQVQDAIIKLDKEGGKGLASFADQAQSATGGIATSLANVKTAVVNGVAGIVKGIGATGIASYLNKFKEGIKGTFSEISGSIILFKQGVVTGDFSEAIAKLGTAFESFVEKSDINFEGLAKRFGKVIPAVISGVAKNLPAMADLALKVVTAFVEGIAASAPVLVTTIAEVVPQIATVLMDNAPALLSAGLSLVVSLADGFFQALPVLASKIPDFVASFVDALCGSDAAFKTAGSSLWVSIVNGITQSLPQFLSYVPEIIIAIVTAIGDNLPMLVSAGLKAADALITGIVNAIPALTSSLVNMMATMVYTILSSLPQLVVAGAKIIGSLIAGLIGQIGLLMSAVGRISSAIVRGVAQIPGKMISAGLNILRGLWRGMSQGVSWLLGKIPGLVSQITSSIKEKFGIHSPSTVLADEVGKFLPPGIAVGFKYEMPDALKNMRNTLGDAVGRLSSDVNVTSNIQRPSYSTSGHLSNQRTSRTAMIGAMLNRPNPVTLTAPTSHSRVNMGGISFSPTIKVETKNGEKMKPETIIKALRDFEPEFIDFVMQALAAREEGAYVTEGAGLY